MSFFLSPIGNSSQIDANGDPGVGFKIATYLAGSTTPTATYTSNTGATAQANPIILNSLGLPASPIWLAEGINYKFVISSAADVVLQTIDNIEGVNDAATSASEWVTSGFVPTFLTTTTFSVPGDQTDTLAVGRRLRTTNTAGTIYSRCTASVFGAVTTVTVVNDSGVLDSGLSVVAYGLLAPRNISIPNSPTIDRAYSEYTANADITTVIPADDTIPQNTEGVQILEATMTPKSATNRVRLRFQGEFSAAAANTACVAAIFSSASANALKTSLVSAYAIGVGSPLAVEHEYVPGVTTALTFTVRVGPGAAGTIRLNGTNTARLFGGSAGATLIVEEIAA